MVVVLRLLIPLSFFGGPLLIADAWRRELGVVVSVLIASVPLFLMLFGALSLRAVPQHLDMLALPGGVVAPRSTFAVRGGLVGALLLFGQNVFAFAVLLGLPRNSAGSLALYATGTTVGTLSALMYAVLAAGGPRVKELANGQAYVPHGGPVRAWVLAPATAICCAVLALSLWSEAPSKALVMFVFFGGFALFPLFARWRQQRAERQLPAPGPALALPADRTLHARAVKELRQLAVWSLFLLMQLVLNPRSWWAFLLTVIVLSGPRLAARALGRPLVDYLRFDADCLTLGRARYLLHVPWSEIAAALPGETSGSAVYISLRAHAQWTTTPLTQRARAEAALKRDARWNGAPIVIAAARYGVDAFALARAVQDERARAAPLSSATC